VRHSRRDESWRRRYRTGFVRPSESARHRHHARRHHVRRHAHHHRARRYRHSYYDRHRFHLSFHFGTGLYLGLRYYYPFYHYRSRAHFAFFYGAPVSYAYVPYGFYCDAPPVYVTRHVHVYEEAPEYDVVETEYDEREGETVEPEPAAGSPTAERYLRQGSEAFREGKYLEAARQFRSAAVSAPDNAAPLFALGQSLIALGYDAYAARVIRQAIELDPGLLEEAGDIVGVYGSQKEFDETMRDLEERAAVSDPDSDERFLLGVQQYFSGDPDARATFEALAEADPEDRVVARFERAAKKRFRAADDLPEIE